VVEEPLGRSEAERVIEDAFALYLLARGGEPVARLRLSRGRISSAGEWRERKGRLRTSRGR
jgi:hypothetical protein